MRLLAKPSPTADVGVLLQTTSHGPCQCRWSVLQLLSDYPVIFGSNIGNCQYLTFLESSRHSKRKISLKRDATTHRFWDSCLQIGFRETQIPTCSPSFGLTFGGPWDINATNAIDIKVTMQIFMPIVALLPRSLYMDKKTVNVIPCTVYILTYHR